ncbi:hypothetical protein N7414_19145 [Pseudomonas sp. GD04087]|uniref:hypothetical protein n=1 Tax=unclassified Pseudomonas TaxID=196821 RepID=UPI00244D1A3D|nr:MULTISPECIES: hypothetical protein [unclassified Pseudomonas]MDH0291244.1 hypothetical protein [Pseudomonas sp. GD04087]MDH1049992.1 hypothetical protein [Pseudomonas sp. GD03903]MDH2003491.1 hypothetical protein [Pseudomonas sp. GD03691]
MRGREGRPRVSRRERAGQSARRLQPIPGTDRLAQAGKVDGLGATLQRADKDWPTLDVGGAVEAGLAIVRWRW